MLLRWWVAILKDGVSALAVCKIWLIDCRRRSPYIDTTLAAGW